MANNDADAHSLSELLDKLTVSSHCLNVNCKAKLEQHNLSSYGSICVKCYNTYLCGYCGQIHLPKR